MRSTIELILGYPIGEAPGTANRQGLFVKLDDTQVGWEPQMPVIIFIHGIDKIIEQAVVAGKQAFFSGFSIPAEQSTASSS